MAAFTALGDTPIKEVIHKHESHKLHQAFNVVDDVTINQGDPCYLMPSGLIQSWTSGVEPANGIFIGVAVTDTLTPAYNESRQRGPIEVTVAVAGYIILWGEASGNLGTNSLYVQPSGRSTATPQLLTWDEASESKFVALYPVSTGELVQILVLN